jgi:hypothetical protein
MPKIQRWRPPSAGSTPGSGGVHSADTAQANEILGHYDLTGQHIAFVRITVQST